jgi:hypothetical protein
MADEIINARVKQKVDTEENWLLNPLILLEGEQGFVWDGENDPVNFKIGDGTKTFAQLPYFIAYYSDVVSHKIIRLPNISVATNIPAIFNDNTNLYDIVITNVGGSDCVFKIGTSAGGSEIGQYKIGAGNTVLDLKYMFNSTQTLYLSGFDGNALSVIIIYFNYSETPAIPPGAPTVSFRWPRNYLGMFMPTGVGQLESCFDMITGMGVVGSSYENCQICNSSNLYLDMTSSYPIGYSVGSTLGSQVGNASNSITISESNIPDYDIDFQIGGVVFQRGSDGSSFRWITSIGSNTSQTAGPSTANGGSGYGDSASINSGGSGIPIDIRPKSKIVLYFLAIND